MIKRLAFSAPRLTKTTMCMFTKIIAWQARFRGKPNKRHKTRDQYFQWSHAQVFREKGPQAVATQQAAQSSCEKELVIVKYNKRLTTRRNSLAPHRIFQSSPASISELIHPWEMASRLLLGVSWCPCVRLGLSELIRILGSIRVRLSWTGLKNTSGRTCLRSSLPDTPEAAARKLLRSTRLQIISYYVIRSCWLADYFFLGWQTQGILERAQYAIPGNITAWSLINSSLCFRLGHIKARRKRSGIGKEDSAPTNFYLGHSILLNGLLEDFDVPAYCP